MLDYYIYEFDIENASLSHKTHKYSANTTERNVMMNQSVCGARTPSFTGDKKVLAKH